MAPSEIAILALSTMRSIAEKIGNRYERIFSIGEIRTNQVLQWMMGVSTLFFFATFDKWLYNAATTIEAATRGSAACWPYFQSCTKLFFLHALPYGYSQMAFYMGLFCIIAAIAYCIARRYWALAHFLLTVLLAWKLFVMFVLTFNLSGNYDYYHVELTFILLFLPYKEYFMKVCFVLLYFLSATAKFHQTWILGTYFTSLKTGMPIFPNSLTPLLTNSVIFEQVIGCWYLLSQNRLWQRIALVYFAVFHLYSGVLVYYHYPTIALTALLVLFGPLYRYTPPPIRLKTAFPGFVFLFLTLIFQLPGHLIFGDQKLTLEGNQYGMYMFEANHQCIAHTTIYVPSKGVPVKESSTSIAPGSPCGNRGACVTSSHTFSEGKYTVQEQTWESSVAWNRCDPYDYWFQVKRYCNRARDVRVAMKFDHSIDGGPFYRIVDESDICKLTYSPFVHNDWIKLPPEAPIVGYPVQNILR